MVKPMKTFSGRRYRNMGLLLLACIISWLLYRGFVYTLHSPSFITGWGLLALTLFLMFYNVRKKVPSVPMLRSSTWLQMHIYLGLLSGFLFLLHIQFRVPNGLFETILAVLFAVVFLSGLYGLYLSRSLPQKLSREGENVIFERIPVIRKQIKDSVEETVLNSIEETDSNTISEFYREHLAGLFHKQHYIWRHIFFSDDYVHGLLEKAAELKRYLSHDELQIMEKIIDHVHSKVDIDYQYARQAMLKYWLFVHIPVTYSLIICAVFHLVLTYAYHGGIF
jgi:hypothetical protein